MSEDILDRRQRLAAALLLTGFDLPANATKAAALIGLASKACPGVFMAEIKAGDRRGSLHAAKELLDALCAEFPVP